MNKEPTEEDLQNTKPHPEEMRQDLFNAYMRGFRNAVSGVRGAVIQEGLRRFPESSYTRGYRAGEVAVLAARAQARQNARDVLASPALAQAQENALCGNSW